MFYTHIHYYQKRIIGENSVVAYMQNCFIKKDSARHGKKVNQFFIQ